jgi:chitin disaccharide deacetylase
MVGGPALADAVMRARRLPDLGIGLHLDLVDGVPTLPRAEIPGLVRRDGRFDRNMARAAMRFFFLPSVRRQLAAEIRAQFERFRATGLRLDHVSAHKHMHLHPTVTRFIIKIGQEFGMKAVRIPSEPVQVLRRAFPSERYSTPLYGPWIDGLNRQLRRAGLVVNDQIFGLAWSGGMVEERVLRLLPHLPDGVSELYFHPAVERTPPLVAAMPGYRQPEELATLLSPSVKELVCALGVRRVSYGDVTAAAG